MNRLVYLIPEFPGQTHNFFWREIQALRELGWEVDIFSTRHPPSRIASTSWKEAALLRTTYLFPPSLGRLLRALMRLLRHPRECGAIVRSIAKADGVNAKGRFRLSALALLGVSMGMEAISRGVEHVHVHSCADAANIALFAHLGTGLTYSLTLHNPIGVYGPNQPEKWRHARFGVVIADWVMADLSSRYGASLPRHIFKAPMGVDTEKFRRSLPYEAPRRDATFNLFCCARLNPSKGHLDLLEAVSILTREGVRVQLIIAGEDDCGGAGFRRELERKIREEGLHDIVQLLGAVSEEAVIERLNRVHVFVLASREEPLGVAIMEAMAMEVPVIATDAGGVPEMISNGANGWLVPPGDPTALARALKRVLDDPQSAIRIGTAGRARIEKNFTHRRSAQAIADGLALPRSSSVERAAPRHATEQMLGEDGKLAAAEYRPIPLCAGERALDSFSVLKQRSRKSRWKERSRAPRRVRASRAAQKHRRV